MTQTTEAVLAQIDSAIEDWQVGPDAMRCNAPAGAGLASMPMAVPVINPAELARFSMRAAVALGDFKRSLAQVAAAMNKMVSDNPEICRLLGLPVHDEHHPRPLSIDGAEYARRRKARKARR